MGKSRMMCCLYSELIGMLSLFSPSTILPMIMIIVQGIQRLMEVIKRLRF